MLIIKKQEDAIAVAAILIKNGYAVEITTKKNGNRSVATEIKIKSEE